MNPDNQTPNQNNGPTANNQAPNQYQQPTMYGSSKPQDLDNPLEVMQPGERVICHIKRHPFGLIGVYFISIIFFVGLLVAAALIPHYVDSLTSQDKLYIFLLAVVLDVVVLLYMYVAATIYNGNRWIVTSDSITQITQVGLFRKQTSQLSLGNLEDVTFDQNGLLQSMLGFGTLHVETAGEHSKFVFPFCPTPQQCAREIIQAHEQYIAANPEEGSRDNRGVNLPVGNNGNFDPTNPQR